MQRFAYRQVFSVVLFKTVKRAIQGQKFAWDKLERTAAMTHQPRSQGSSKDSSKETSNDSEEPVKVQ